MDFEDKKMFLGIELGSTRIKAVLTDELSEVIAIGNFEWGNNIINGYFTYSMEEAIKGVQEVFAKVSREVLKITGKPLKRLCGIGISAMMHGFLVLNKNDELLTPFRNWQNTNTSVAAERLIELFAYNVPLRFSVSHLYQAILDKENYINDIAYITTLSGYIHYLLTGERVLGVGDAAGMFPIDNVAIDYKSDMVASFDKLLQQEGLMYEFNDIFPKVLSAGNHAGNLTDAGARLLDPAGELLAGVPFCPPEGDAATGMVATNAVSACTGNISVGTSIFAMLVLENELKNYYREVDIVATPSGEAVAMIHCNTGTSDIDNWINLFSEMFSKTGFEIDKNEIYKLFYNSALEADSDCGGLLNYNFATGEPLVNLEKGVPIFLRKSNSKFNFSNFARTHIYSMIAPLKIGINILEEMEGVGFSRIFGHGGFFKVPYVGQQLLATALDIPVVVNEKAGEGGPFGMSVLASYMIEKNEDEKLCDYLSRVVFRNESITEVFPDKEESVGFQKFIKSYKNGIEIEGVQGILD